MFSTIQDDKLRQYQELAEASKAELKRATLTSMPLKFEFAKEMGFKTDVHGLSILDQVHEWMSATHKRFKAAVEAIA